MTNFKIKIQDFLLRMKNFIIRQTDKGCYYLISKNTKIEKETNTYVKLNLFHLSNSNDSQ